MTPDTLHYFLQISGGVAVSALVLAALVLHRRLRSRCSSLLLLGLLVALSGHALQLFSPVDDLAYEEFRGIVVASGAFPMQWYAGQVVSALGLLITAAGGLGLAFTAPREARVSD
jgi:hypothetical protein